MMHEERRWCVVPVASPEELARILTGTTWCCCAGFEFSGYLFLNDATCADGAQEYAVVNRGSPGEGWRQVESITFSWCNYHRALGHIRTAVAGGYDDADHTVQVHPLVETPEQHGRCGHCA
jgi:hypothetical protein